MGRVEDWSDGVVELNKSQTPSTKSQGFRCQVSEMIDLNTETLFGAPVLQTRCRCLPADLLGLTIGSGNPVEIFLDKSACDCAR